MKGQVGCRQKATKIELTTQGRYRMGKRQQANKGPSISTASGQQPSADRDQPKGAFPKIREFQLHPIEEELSLSRGGLAQGKTEQCQFGELASSVHCPPSNLAQFESAKSDKVLQEWLFTPQPSNLNNLTNKELPFERPERPERPSLPHESKCQTDSYSSPFQYWFSCDSATVHSSKFKRGGLKVVHSLTQ